MEQERVFVYWRTWCRAPPRKPKCWWKRLPGKKGRNANQPNLLELITSPEVVVFRIVCVRSNKNLTGWYLLSCWHTLSMQLVDLLCVRLWRGGGVARQPLCYQNKVELEKDFNSDFSAASFSLNSWSLVMQLAFGGLCWLSGQYQLSAFNCFACLFSRGCFSTSFLAK